MSVNPKEITSNFLAKKNIEVFNELKKNIGEVVVVAYNQSDNPDLPPENKKIMGRLEEVKDFVGVKVGGKVIYFANRKHIIREIVDYKTKKMLLNWNAFVSKDMKVGEKLTQKELNAMLGIQNPESAKAKSMIEQVLTSTADKAKNAVKAKVAKIEDEASKYHLVVNKNGEAHIKKTKYVNVHTVEVDGHTNDSPVKRMAAKALKNVNHPTK